jgi:hypothetical protein
MHPLRAEAPPPNLRLRRPQVEAVMDVAQRLRPHRRQNPPAVSRPCSVEAALVSAVYPW